MLFTIQFHNNITSHLSIIIQITGLVFMFIGIWFGLRLFRVNQLEVNNPNIADRLNDESEQITRLRSLANGFIAYIVVYSIYLFIAVALKILFDNPSYFDLSGVFVGGLTLIIAFFVSVFTYFRHNRK